MFEAETSLFLIIRTSQDLVTRMEAKRPVFFLNLIMDE